MHVLIQQDRLIKKGADGQQGTQAEESGTIDMNVHDHVASPRQTRPDRADGGKPQVRSSGRRQQALTCG